MLNINFRSQKTKKVLIITGIVVLVLVGLVLGIIINTTNKKPVEKIDYTSQGTEAFAKLQYTTSAQLFQKAILQDKNDVNAYLQLAKIYILKNKTDLAIQTLENGLSENAENTSLLSTLIDQYKLSGNNDKVLELSKVIIPLLTKSNDQSIDIAKYVLYQFNIEKLSNFEQAKINLSKYQIDLSGKLTGENADQINFILALTEWQDPLVSKQYLASIKNETRKAEVDYIISQLDKYKGNEDEVSLNIARLMVNIELAIPALNLIGNIIQNNSEYYGGYLVKGIAEFQLGKLDESKADLIKSYQLNANALSQFYLAKIYEKQNLVQQSADAYEKSLLIEPSNLITYKNYAEMLYRANLFTQSVSIYQKLLDKSEHNSAALTNYMRLCEILFYKSNDIQALFTTADKLTRFWTDIKEYPENQGLITFYKTWSEYQLNSAKPENAQSLAFYTGVYKSLQALDTTYPNTAIINYHLGIVLKTVIQFLTEQTDIDSFSKLEKSYLQKALELDTTGYFASRAQDLIKKFELKNVMVKLNVRLNHESADYYQKFKDKVDIFLTTAIKTGLQTNFTLEVDDTDELTLKTAIQKTLINSLLELHLLINKDFNLIIRNFDIYWEQVFIGDIVVSSTELSDFIFKHFVFRSKEWHERSSRSNTDETKLPPDVRNPEATRY